VELAPIDLAELVQALQAATSGLPRPSTVAFEWEVPLGVRTQIMTDRAKIALVVRNLVGNAFKFTSEGKVTVRMAPVGEDLAVELAPIDLAELVQALQAATSGLPRPSTVAFEWEVPLGVRTQIMTDRAKIALVVRNLVGNAFKFTSEGKVTVRMAPVGEDLVV